MAKLAPALCVLMKVINTVSTEHTVLMVSGFELGPRPGMFAVLYIHKMDVPLIANAQWVRDRKKDYANKVTPVCVN